MIRYLLRFLIFTLLFVSCEKDDVYVDPDYPTTFNKLSDEVLSQMRTSFALKNKYMTSSLNEFGFCDYLEYLLPVESPPLQDSITEFEVINIIKDFISKNSTETGVENPDDITFYNFTSDLGYGGTIWHFRSSYQKVDTIEVIDAQIVFHITNGEITCCTGNWYPEIYVPKHFNINQDKAKTDLIGKVVTHSSMTGEEFYVTISKADIESSTINLEIFPINIDDKIELRVIWIINIPTPVFYRISVDVMTGEIIWQAPTIFS